MVAAALMSAKGSPGVTTSALALIEAWPGVHPDRRVLLAECDAAGGDIASGYLGGSLDDSRGVVSLAAQRSTEAVQAVWQQVLALDGDARRLLLPGLSDPSRASAMETAWSRIAEALAGFGRQSPPIDVLIDLGRMRTIHEAVLLRRRADLAVLVTGTSLPAVVAARAAAAQLRATGDGDEAPRVVALVVGEGRPYNAAEVKDAIGLPVIGTMPYDPAAAAVFSSGSVAGRHFPRSPLVRAARALAGSLLDRVFNDGTVLAAAELERAGRG